MVPKVIASEKPQGGPEPVKEERERDCERDASQRRGL